MTKKSLIWIKIPFTRDYKVHYIAGSLTRESLRRFLIGPNSASLKARSRSYLIYHFLRIALYTQKSVNSHVSIPTEIPLDSSAESFYLVYNKESKCWILRVEYLDKSIRVFKFALKGNIHLVHESSMYSLVKHNIDIHDLFADIKILTSSDWLILEIEFLNPLTIELNNLKEIITLLKRVNQAGFSHGDAAFWNFGTSQSGEIKLFDLESMVEEDSDPLKDLTRFIYSLHAFTSTIDSFEIVNLLNKEFIETPKTTKLNYLSYSRVKSGYNESYQATTLRSKIIRSAASKFSGLKPRLFVEISSTSTEREYYRYLDLFIASLGNLVLTLYISRVEGSKELGYFSITFFTYVFILGFSRAFYSETFLIDKRKVLAKSSLSLSFTLLPSFLFSTMLIASSLLMNEQLSGYFIVLGFVLPGLILFDNVRFILFSAQKSFLVIALDFFWTVGLFGFMLITFFKEIDSLLIFAVWGLIPTILAISFVMLTKTKINLRNAVRWFKETVAYWKQQVIQFFLFFGIYQGVIVLYLLQSPPVEVSQYKLSMTILAPIPIIVSAMTLNSVITANTGSLGRKFNFVGPKNHRLAPCAMLIWFLGSILFNDEILRHFFKAESFSVFKYLLPLFLQYSAVALSVRFGGVLRLAKKQDLITRTYFINCLTFSAISPFCFLMGGLTATIWLVTVLAFANLLLLRFYASRKAEAKEIYL